MASEWADLRASPSALRLRPTLLSGMSFRWQYREPSRSYLGVLGQTAFELREHEHTVTFRTLGSKQAAEQEQHVRLLRAHLSLDRGCDIQKKWLDRTKDAPDQFLRAASVLQGVRVLTIDRLEALVAFMGSANNNIKRNMQMIEKLCSEFEENWICDDEYGSSYYVFPSVEQMLRLSEARLWEIGWGYRAPRLFKLARQLNERGADFLDCLPSSEACARAQLCELCGVGRKVADCVLLFAYGYDGCVPVDTHCFQMAQRFLLPSARGKTLTAALYSDIVKRFHDIFGEDFAGWAFMTMFVGELSDFRGRLASKAPFVKPNQLSCECENPEAAGLTIEQLPTSLEESEQQASVWQNGPLKSEASKSSFGSLTAMSKAERPSAAPRKGYSLRTRRAGKNISILKKHQVTATSMKKKNKERVGCDDINGVSMECSPTISQKLIVHTKRGDRKLIRGSLERDISPCRHSARIMTRRINEATGVLVKSELSNRL
ncbi:MAG: hypothetical protein SGPRY_004541 [Prymnesium sp.]